MPLQLHVEHFTFHPGEDVPEHIPGDPSLAEQDPRKFHLLIRTAARERVELEKLVAANIDSHDVGVALMKACQRQLNDLREADDPKRSAMLVYPTK